MRLYVAGPMSGVFRFNFPAFDAAKHRLSFKGYTVVSPADIDRNHGFDPESLPVEYDWSKMPPGLDYEAVLKRDLAALAGCEAIALLPGWETSKGANRELARAKELGLAVYLYDETEPGLLRAQVPEVGHESTRLLELCEAVAAQEDAAEVVSRQCTNNCEKSEALTTNPKTIAGRKKPPLSIIPFRPLCEVAKALQHGADKYGRWNWRDAPVSATSHAEPIMRHVMAYLDGEDIDPDSGLSHLAHVISAAFVLLDAVTEGCCIDDRPRSAKCK